MGCFVLFGVDEVGSDSEVFTEDYQVKRIVLGILLSL